MVTKDHRYNHLNSPSHSLGKQTENVSNMHLLAAPVDRLAAGVFDLLVVLVPLVVLFVSPLRRNIMESLLTQNEVGFVFSVLGVVITSMIVVIVYQTLMHKFVSATLGKMLLGLKVEHVWDGSAPSLGQSFLRSLIWVLNAFLFFIPYLEIFSNKYRRAIHDRLSDTMVVARQNKKSSPHPGLFEQSAAKGIFSALLIFVGLTVLGVIASLWQEVKKDNYLAQILESNKTLCTEVGEAVRNWPRDGGYRPDRLRVAMSLFAAGTISKPCLAQETDYVLNRLDRRSALAYLASAFVHSENAELSNAYLDEVCELDAQSDSCRVSQVVEHWSEEDWGAVSDLLAELNTGSEIYIIIWGIRHYMRQHLYREAVVLLEHIPSIPALAGFLTKNRVQALWSLGRQNEAEAATFVALESLKPTESLELAGWLCLEELYLGCENKTSKSCEFVDRSLAMSELLLHDRRLAMTYVLSQECSGSLGKQALRKKHINEEVKSLLPLLLQSQNIEKKKVNSQEWKKLARNSSIHPLIRTEARRRWAALSEETGELSELLSEWKEMKSQSEEWRHLGRSLFRSYFNLGSYRESVGLGRELWRAGLVDSFLVRSLVVALYHQGERFEAWKHGLYYDMNWEIPTRRVQTRGLASEDEFSAIRNILTKEFSKR